METDKKFDTTEFCKNLLEACNFKPKHHWGKQWSYLSDDWDICALPENAHIIDSGEADVYCASCGKKIDSIEYESFEIFENTKESNKPYAICEFCHKKEMERIILIDTVVNFGTDVIESLVTFMINNNAIDSKKELDFLNTLKICQNYAINSRSDIYEKLEESGCLYNWED